MTTNKRIGTAIAHPNIAFIKYWGNINEELRLAANDSISMNLAELETRTTVEFIQTPSLDADELTINNAPVTGSSLQRVTRFLDIARERAGIHAPARVSSTTNFPIGAGIASSAAAFAALAVAASAAAGLPADTDALSRYARRGSGSACRSIPGGFVEWKTGSTDETSFAVSFADSSHWNLVDLIAVIDEEHKPVGSTAGHALAGTSVLQTARLGDTPRRFAMCKQTILEQDFETFAAIVEQDSTIMHAVMMTSQPPLFYWSPTSLHLMKLIPEWRRNGLPVCYTLDAGANVHVITTQDYAQAVEQQLGHVAGVQSIFRTTTGEGARLCNDD